MIDSTINVLEDLNAIAEHATTDADSTSPSPYDPAIGRFQRRIDANK